MNTIYKYPICAGKISIPLGGIIRKVGIDATGIRCAWVEIDVDENQYHTIEVNIIGTGWGIESDIGTYFDTFFEGAYVWHVYIKYA